MSRLVAPAVFALAVLFVPLEIRAEQLYWTDMSFGRILRANLDGSGLETVLGDLPGASALAVDQAAGKMYWSETSTGTAMRIRRANLDGSGVETLLDTPSRVSEIALDPPSNTMYFAQAFSPVPEIGQAIRAANLDGSLPRDVVTGGDVKAETVAFIDGRVYYTSGTGGSILSVEPDGSARRTEVEIAGGGTFAILSHPVTGGLYWLDEDDDYIRSGGNFNLFRLRSLNSEPTQEFFPWGLAVDAQTGRIYWSDAATRTIQSIAVNTDGEGTDYQVVLNVEGSPGRMVIVVPEPTGVLLPLLVGALFYRCGRRARPILAG